MDKQRTSLTTSTALAAAGAAALASLYEVTERWLGMGTGWSIALMAAGSGALAALLLRRFRRLDDAARAAEARLRDSERFAHALLEHSSDLIAILNRDGTIRFASPSHETILGYVPGELIGRNAFDFVHPDDMPSLLQTFTQGMAAGSSALAQEFRFRHWDGTWRSLESIAKNALDDPAIAGAVINSRDVTARRQAEDALRDSTRWLELLLGQLPAMLWTTDRSLHITSASGGALRSIQQRSSDALGQTVAEYFGDSDAGAIPRLAHRRALDGDPQDYELAWLGRYFLAHLEPLRDLAGEIAGVIGVAQDITDRRRVESDRSALLEMAHDIAGTLELDELLTRVQKRTTEVLPCDGVATVQYDTPTDSFRMLSQVGMPAALIATTADLPLPRSARSGVGVRAETVVINDLAERGEAMTKLFRQHGLTALAAVPLLVHGRLVGTLVAFMTGEKRFHAPQVQLLESIGQQLGVAIEAADLYAAQREEGTVAAALARVGRELISELDRPVLLDRLCRLTVEEIGCDISRTYLLDRERAEYAVVAGFGNTPEEWEALRVVRVPKQQVDQYGLHNADVIEIDLRRTTLGYDPFKAPHEAPRLLAMALRRGGELVGVHEALFRSRAEPCAAAQRRIAQGLAQLASLGLENARLVEELDRASRVKADFVASMSHELRTPLNVIIGYSDLLVDQVFGELVPEQRETVRRIGEQGRELLDLVNTTLEMSRIDSGRVPLALREVDLVDLLAEIDLEAQLVRRNAALDLRWQVTPPVPRLWTDPMKLKVIIKNLLLNALKFTDEGGVLVHAESRDGGVEIAVSDTGIGIAPEMIPRMFEAFRQGDHGAARRGGVGLGLHIVRRLLDVLGGTIDVESEPQRGSTFRIWLPCNAAVERRDDVAVHAAARSVDT